jgi:hypothetical protein
MIGPNNLKINTFMKNLLFSLLLLLVLASACNKTTDPTNQPTNYRVNNITAISIDANKGYHALLQYNLVSTGPVQETVTLSFEGLPDGVVMDTANAYLTRTGIPGFTAYIHLMATDTANTPGNYKVKLVCTGSVTGKKYYDVDLVVSAPKQHLLGAARPCDLETTVVDDLGNIIIFKHGIVQFYGFGDLTKWNFEVGMDCDGNFNLSGIEVPSRITTIYSGWGSFSMQKNKWVFSSTVLYDEYGDHVSHYSDILITIPL